MYKIIALTMVLFAGAAALGQEKAVSPTPTAVEFAKYMRSHDQLRLMLKAVAEQTVTIRGLIAAHSAAQVEPVLASEVERVASMHDDEWNSNLAICYQEHFVESELRSLITETQSSPYLQKLKDEMPGVGKSMQIRSQALLTIAAQDVIISTFRHFRAN